MTMKPTYKTKSNLYRKVSGKKGLSNFHSYQRGGTLPPIYTSDRNDPRLKRYSDSLNAYSKGEADVARIKNALNVHTKKRNNEGYFWENPLVPRYYEDKLYPSKSLPNYRGIKPVSVGTAYNYPDVSGFLGGFRESSLITKDPKKYYEGQAYRYKKPVQPVIYSNKKDSARNKPSTVNTLRRVDKIVEYVDPKIVEKQKKLKEAGLYTGKLDGIWGDKSKEAWKKYEEGLSAGKTTTTTTTSTTPTTLATTTTAVKPPVVTKPAIYTAPTPVQKKTTSQPSTDTPWRFLLGNDSYQTFDEETAKTFAKDLGITNLQRGDNKNIDPVTEKYRDYSSLVTPVTTNIGTTGTITKYPKLKRMEYGGQIAKGSRLKKLYTAYKTRR